jgi:hypothetical protein
VTEPTKDKTVDPETFARLSAHYSEREICEIVWLVASDYLYNMTNIGLNGQRVGRSTLMGSICR